MADQPPNTTPNPGDGLNVSWQKMNQLLFLAASGSVDPGLAASPDDSINESAYKSNQILATGTFGGGGGGGATGPTGPTGPVGATGPTGPTQQTVTQASHGFAVKDVLRMNGATYVKAQADSASNAEVIGMVTSVPTANTFVLTTFGFASGLSGLTAGATYFLDPATAGAITATEPTVNGQVSKPVFISTTTTAGYFFNMRGAVIGSPNLPYKVYTALLLQEGSDAPVATVLGAETIDGNLTWSYVDVGRYRLTSDNPSAFPETKTGVFVTNPFTSGALALKTNRVTDDTAELFAFDEAGAPIDMGASRPATFEIRVYS